MELLHGWVCPICREVFEDEKIAQGCLNAHVEYTMESQSVLSSPWPVNIRIWKEVAGEKVEWKDYNPEPTTHNKRK